MPNNNTTVELELTYLARELPEEIFSTKPTKMTDVYVPESSEHPRLRIRRKGEGYEITKKVPVSEGDSSKHLESTIPIDKDEFKALAKSSSKQVSKYRYNVVIDGSPAEVDVFDGDLSGLVVIDFEFNDEISKSKFTPPDCCLVDVTEEMFIAGGILAGKKYEDIVP